MGYTGKVRPGGPADVRELPLLIISKVSVGTMDNNAYLLRCVQTGSRLLIDVKGRRFPMGPEHKPRRVWECWSTREDVDGLESWVRLFGYSRAEVLDEQSHVTGDSDLPRVFICFWSDTAI